MVQVVDPRAQNLRIWIERKYVQAYDIASNAGAPETYRFLPRGAAEKHLRDNNNLWTRLLLKETFGDQNGPDAKSVAQNYCRILCILTTLSKQRFIASFVNYTSLSDARLPFETRPSNFPDDPDDPHFYTKFFERQWHFCSRVLEKHTSSLIPKHEVLPILNLDRRGTGGSATVYRATVHEDHDQLRQSSSDDESPSTDPAHCYAIKTFRHSRRDSEPSYEQEKTAFQLLTQTRDGASPGLIAFYGGFEYGDTFNILLEYADGGNLNEYMRDHDQPQTYQEAVDLWSHVFDTIKGLCCIHNIYLHDSGANHQRFMRQGWHFDIKPDNILLVKAGASSPFQWQLKIADLGLAHFQIMFDGEPEDVCQDKFGTRTYGAPETYSPSRHTEFHKNNVKRSIDIWSLGAVFSEIAVWTVKGWSGVLEFRRRRQEALGRINGFRISDCFHDGRRPLSVVSKLSDDVHPPQSHARTDHDEPTMIRHITSSVVNGMILEMMHENPDHRPTAAQLDRKAETIIERAERFGSRSVKAGQSGSSKSNPQSPSSTTHWPDLPDLRHLATDPDGIEMSQQVRIEGPQRMLGLHGHRDIYGHGTSPQSSFGNGNSPPQSWGISAPPHTRLSISTPSAPGMGRTNSLHIPRQRHRSSDSSGAGSRLSANGFGPTSRTGAIEESDHEFPAAASTNQASDDRASPPNPAFQEGVTHSHAQLRRSGGQLMAREHLSVEEVRRWYKARKEGDKNARLRNEYLLTSLKDRDHVFIIDDAESMEEHWEEVKELAKLLIYITKTVDKDGVDVAFLSSPKFVNFKRSNKAAQYIGRQHPADKASLDTVLDQEVQNYCRKIDAYRNPVTIMPRSLRRRSLYILTNGLLEHGGPNQGHDAIETLVTKLVSASMGRAQFGIQFIRFGNHPDGIARLDAMDRLNQSRSLRRDIVDSEPSNGNVWKMLQGLINEGFDDDSPD